MTKEEKRLYDAQYRVKNRDRIREARRRWGIAHPEREKELNQQHQDRKKQKVIDAYGGKCACCGETEIRFLGIDHIYNDGADHRRQLKSEGGFSFYCWLQRQGFPQDRFQCLCMNCNFGKRRTGTCPHKQNEEKGK